MFGLRKRRMSDSALGSQQAGEKRSRAHLAHVEAAIQQVGTQFHIEVQATLCCKLRRRARYIVVQATLTCGNMLA